MFVLVVMVERTESRTARLTASRTKYVCVSHQSAGEGCLANIRTDVQKSTLSKAPG